MTGTRLSTFAGLRKTTVLTATVIAAMAACAAQAHSLVMRPSQTDVFETDDASIRLEIEFTHPMEQGPRMNMEKPVRFGVLLSGEENDLRESLVPHKANDVTYYSAAYDVMSPGDHIFFIEPAPYWEPAEGKMIVHYTKVIVNAFGAGDGWDAMAGFPVEIRPLTRPYGLWTGNIFRGIVTKNGVPVPFAEIEVEYFNENAEVEIPNDSFVTQTTRAGADGEFSYAMPRAGWWGFAALIDGDEPMPNPEGRIVPVELGALIWIKCTDMGK